VKSPAANFAVAALLTVFSAAQTITVDVSHSVNHFVPSETLGAGVDRIPVEAIDRDLLPPSLEAALSSGWQTVSYRQNTELALRVLNSVRKRDREVLIRFYLKEQTAPEICRDMDLSDTQFRLIKSRAKTRFGELGRSRLRLRTVAPRQLCAS